MNYGSGTANTKVIKGSTSWKALNDLNRRIVMLTGKLHMIQRVPHYLSLPAGHYLDLRPTYLFIIQPDNGLQLTVTAKTKRELREAMLLYEFAFLTGVAVAQTKGFSDLTW